MSIAQAKILIHLKDRRRLVVDVHDVYYLEAQGDETDIRQLPWSRSGTRSSIACSHSSA